MRQVFRDQITSLNTNFQSESPIITDLKMPWLDGLNFCKKAKRLNPNLKIYALSGFLYEFDIEELENAGFDGFYEKPINKAQLAEILNADKNN